jgi:hypothetical protein
VPHTGREVSPKSPREPGVTSVFPDGWDCEARLVDGRWAERRPALTVRHVVVPGEPLEELDASQGRTLGLFLRALHKGGHR